MLFIQQMKILRNSNVFLLQQMKVQGNGDATVPKNKDLKTQK